MRSFVWGKMVLLLYMFQNTEEGGFQGPLHSEVMGVCLVTPLLYSASHFPTRGGGGGSGVFLFSVNPTRCLSSMSNDPLTSSLSVSQLSSPTCFFQPCCLVKAAITSHASSHPVTLGKPSQTALDLWDPPFFEGHTSQCSVDCSSDSYSFPVILYQFMPLRAWSHVLYFPGFLRPLAQSGHP